MPRILWDASALIKRYISEVGSPTVNAIVGAPNCEMITTLWGYAEMFAILNRRLNSGILTQQLFASQLSALQNELLVGSAYTMLSITDASVLASLPLIQSHSLNSADAAILTSFLSFRAAYPGQERSFVLVAADQRLARAGAAEGFTVINPEIVNASDTNAVLASI